MSNTLCNTVVFVELAVVSLSHCVVWMDAGKRVYSGALELPGLVQILPSSEALRLTRKHTPGCSQSQ